jgi:hypothetical protein
MAMPTTAAIAKMIGMLAKKAWSQLPPLLF